MSLDQVEAAPQSQEMLPLAPRPAVQRTEIGPMLHEFAHTVYDIAEETLRDKPELLDGVTLPSRAEAISQESLLSIGLSVKWTVDDELYEDSEGLRAIYYVTQRHLESLPARVSPLTQRSLPSYFTIAPDTALHEGIDSGIVVPVRLLCEIEYEKAAQAVRRPFSESHHQLPRIKFSAPKVIETLNDPVFDTMLHQLAYGPNGYLGIASSKFDKHTDRLRCFDPFTNTWGRFQGYPIEFGPDGKPTGFSKEFLDWKQEQFKKKRATSADDPIAFSGGCPVRHASFARIGEKATAYLQELQELDDGPNTGLIHEGESAISRGRRLVSFAMELAFERKGLLDHTESAATQAPQLVGPELGAL